MGNIFLLFWVQRISHSHWNVDFRHPIIIFNLKLISVNWNYIITRNVITLLIITFWLINIYTINIFLLWNRTIKEIYWAKRCFSLFILFIEFTIYFVDIKIIFCILSDHCIKRFLRIWIFLCILIRILV